MTGVIEKRQGAAMVLFSGGQDSTTCLAWALSRFDRVETIGFDYGQRHRVELDCRRDVLEKNPCFQTGMAGPAWRGPAIGYESSRPDQRLRSDERKGGGV